MRIAAMAAGAVGGYFGARLAADGHDVFLIARGAHRDAITRNGLTIESVHGDLHLPKVNVTDDPKTVGPVDVVMFAVKLWDTEKAAELTRPLVGPNTRVITLQNGVDSVERIAPILGADQTIGGVAYIATVVEKPGVIKHTSQFATMHFGRADKKPDAVLDAFAAAGKKAKCDIDLSKDIQVERWEKFIFLTAMAGSTASRRSSIGPMEERRDAVEPAIAVRKMNFSQRSTCMSFDKSMSHLAFLPAAANASSVASGFLSACPKCIVANWLVCLMTPGCSITVAI